MHIIHFEINNFRNILSGEFVFNKRFNVFFGKNGAGKTSVLEAIYVLGTGRSFRVNHQQSLINHDHNKFILFARINNNDKKISIGIERALRQSSRTHIDEVSVKTYADVTRLLPIQLIASKDYRLLEGGAEFRRQFLDFGVFHVEPTFLSLWQKCNRAIKQRNALIKNRDLFSYEQLYFWNNEIAVSGLDLHAMRNSYIELFKPLFFDVLQKVFNDMSSSISLEYYPGWNLDVNLQKLLLTNLHNDMRLGCTSVGPHRADIKITIRNTSHQAQNILSRGQQKLLIYALRLTHGILLKKYKNVDCIYLIDDLPSELDYEKAANIIDFLIMTDSQIFITGIDRNSFSRIPFDVSNLFHVEQGNFINLCDTINDIY